MALSFSFEYAFSLTFLNSNSSKITKCLVEVKLYTYRVDFSLQEYKFTSTRTKTLTRKKTKELLY